MSVGEKSGLIAEGTERLLCGLSIGHSTNSVIQADQDGMEGNLS